MINELHKKYNIRFNLSRVWDSRHTLICIIFSRMGFIIHSKVWGFCLWFFCGRACEHNMLGETATSNIHTQMLWLIYNFATDKGSNKLLWIVVLYKQQLALLAHQATHIITYKVVYHRMCCVYVSQCLVYMSVWLPKSSHSPPRNFIKYISASKRKLNIWRVNVIVTIVGKAANAGI